MNIEHPQETLNAIEGILEFLGDPDCDSAVELEVREKLELLRAFLLHDIGFQAKWIASNKWQNLGGLEAQRLAARNIEFQSWNLEERLGSIH